MNEWIYFISSIFWRFWTNISITTRSTEYNYIQVNKTVNYCPLQEFAMLWHRLLKTWCTPLDFTQIFIGYDWTINTKIMQCLKERCAAACWSILVEPVPFILPVADWALSAINTQALILLVNVDMNVNSCTMGEWLNRPCAAINY